MRIRWEYARPSKRTTYEHPFRARACVAAANQTGTWTNYCQCFVSNSNKWGSTAGGFSYETESVDDRWSAGFEEMPADIRSCWVP